MIRIRPSWGLLLLIVIATMVPLPCSGSPAPAPKPVGPVPKGRFTTSDTCGNCHADIYRTWQTSAHARSMEDPVFLEALRQAEARHGQKVARTCLGCHAPMVTVNGDWSLEQKITWEGVSCDVCHSLASVELTDHGPRQVLDVGAVKRGPIQDAASVGHEVRFSELHTSSLGCAGCHEFVNAEGTPILTTYREWQASSTAAEGKTCQTCHMAKTRANVVDPRVLRSAHAEVNLHDVPGGHSLDQLHKALRVTLHTERRGDELLLEVHLTNRGAGHAVPTGMPGRRVVLEVEVRGTQGHASEERRIYGKFFVDAEGRRIDHDGDYFAPGVRLESDSRILADEKRVEQFRFPVAASATAFLTVKLHYEHAPTGAEGERTWLTFFSENRALRPLS